MKIDRKQRLFSVHKQRQTCTPERLLLDKLVVLSTPTSTSSTRLSLRTSDGTSNPSSTLALIHNSHHANPIPSPITRNPFPSPFIRNPFDPSIKVRCSAEVRLCRFSNGFHRSAYCLHYNAFRITSVRHFRRGSATQTHEVHSLAERERHCRPRQSFAAHAIRRKHT